MIHKEKREKSLSRLLFSQNIIVSHHKKQDNLPAWTNYPVTNYPNFIVLHHWLQSRAYTNRMNLFCNVPNLLNHAHHD